MGGFLRPDLQTLLAQAPNGTPDMPIFEEGAIPPVFGPEFPDPNELETIEMPVSEELGPVSVGQPVPPARESRGDRLRKLLGNFLQNFGEGLTAAARAPSGSGFAAGFGAALSAPEERRQQQAREELLRENQKSRQEQAAAIQQIRERQLAIQEQSRLDRQAAINRQGIFRKEERLQRRFQDIIESRKGREKEKRTRTFLKGQQKERLEATAEQGRLSRKLQREQATTRAEGKLALSVKDAFSLAFQEVRVGLSAEDPLGKERTFKNATEAISFARKRAVEIFREANGIGPSREELAAVIPRAGIVKDVLSELKEAKKLGFSDEELVAQVTRFRLSDELTEDEEELVLTEAGLVEEKLSQRESFRRNIQRRKQIEESRKTRIPGTLPSFLRKIR